MTTTTPHINELRQHLMNTLADLRNRETPMEPDRARAVAQVASVLVDTARVEVDYIKATGADRSNFLEGEPGPVGLPAPDGMPSAHQPFPGTTVHRLRG